MSIHRSGLTKPVYMICKTTLHLPDLTINQGQKVELVHDMGTMCVVKNEAGKEAVVPKDSLKEDA